MLRSLMIGAVSFGLTAVTILATATQGAPLLS
ncbi:hypothetical protein FHT02_003251 [Sphingomonas xinjiangensis]|uniref:Uncharacterized protein n=1 Tax=Sphingomonas xinjiangensis TaxID=643568 RepID=A0A840YL43_9SPHN|nr:hypothetical protein [Sphingomonas xinjiangensis]